MELNNSNQNQQKKTMDRTTLLSYIGIGVLSILIIIPPMFRIVFAKPVEIEKKKEMVRITLSCHKNELGSDYLFTRTINNIYEDNVIKDSTFIFEVSQRPGSQKIPTINEIDAPDLKEFENINNENVIKTSTEAKKSFQFDYRKNSFNEINILTEHKKVIQAQISLYRTEEYSCDTNSEIIEITD